MMHAMKKEIVLTTCISVYKTFMLANLSIQAQNSIGEDITKLKEDMKREMMVGTGVLQLGSVRL